MICNIQSRGGVGRVEHLIPILHCFCLEAMTFLGQIFIILLLKKGPKHHGQGKFLKKNSKKLSHFKEKIMKLSSFLKILGKFIAFFF
jgi:hypothetical protein